MLLTASVNPAAAKPCPIPEKPPGTACNGATIYKLLKGRNDMENTLSFLPFLIAFFSGRGGVFLRAPF